VVVLTRSVRRCAVRSSEPKDVQAVSILTRSDEDYFRGTFRWGASAGRRTAVLQQVSRQSLRNLRMKAYSANVIGNREQR
jgi:hypothetical protein